MCQSSSTVSITAVFLSLLFSLLKEFIVTTPCFSYEWSFRRSVNFLWKECHRHVPRSFYARMIWTKAVDNHGYRNSDSSICASYCYLSWRRPDFVEFALWTSLASLKQTTKLWSVITKTWELGRYPVNQIQWVVLTSVASQGVQKAPRIVKRC